jgi:hypothetical protein
MSEAGGIPCGHHPERPAAAVCIDCETPLCFACRHVGHDGLSRCEACLEQTRLPALSRADDDAPAEPEPPLFVPETLPDDTVRALPAPEPPEPQSPADKAEAAARLVATVEPIPWEQAERYPAPLAMWLTLTAILRSPLHAVVRIPWERRDFVTPLVLAVSAGVLGHIGILVSAFLFADLNAVLGPQFHELGVSPVAGALIAMTTVPLGITLKLFLASALSHFLLKSVGAARRPYEATFRIFAYAGVTSLLALIPGLGAPLAMAMTLLVVLLGIRVAHRATPGQSFLGAAPHFVALLLSAGV